MSTTRSTRTVALAGVLALGMGGSGIVLAQSTSSAPMEKSPQSMSSSGQMQSGQPMSSGGQMHASKSTQGKIDQSISQAKASELIGKEVVNADGTKIGKVSEVARKQQDQSLQLVVKTGGHLGMGEKHMALPLEQVRMQGKELHLTQALTQDRIKQYVASYDKQSYQPISRQQQQETVAQLEQSSKAG
jgi:sporulation protein YlmC with PRC-barrel domain